MFTLKANHNEWLLLNEKGEKVLFGKGRLETGIAICKAHGFVVSKITKTQYLRAA